MYAGKRPAYAAVSGKKKQAKQAGPAFAGAGNSAHDQDGAARFLTKPSAAAVLSGPVVLIFTFMALSAFWKRSRRPPSGSSMSGKAWLVKTAVASSLANKCAIAQEVSRRRGSLGVEGRVADGEQESERYRRCHLGSATQPALQARKAVVLPARRRPGGACEESNRLSDRWKSMHTSMTA